MTTHRRFDRTARLLGDEGVARLGRATITVVGVGGAAQDPVREPEQVRALAGQIVGGDRGHAPSIAPGRARGSAPDSSASTARGHR